MATSSILGGRHAPAQPRGGDMESLGPSDSTDSGSDSRGAYGPDELHGDSDRAGTGERSSLQGNVRSDADILPDHVERSPDGGDLEALPLEEEGEDGVEMDDADAAEINIEDLVSEDDDEANESIEGLDDDRAGS